jgi:hypothetical protein
MDNFTSFNGKPASNGSGSQGDGASQGGLPLPPNGAQGAGENPGSFSGDPARQTLWMGELAGWMDEQFIRSIFASSMNEQVQVKIIRDRHSG